MRSSLDSRRIRLARRIGSIIDEAARNGVNSREQEPAISGRIAGALQRELAGRTIAGFKVDIVTYQLPSSGKGALEKAVGADLYIGVKLSNISSYEKGGWEKGLLVQSKKEKDGARLSASNADILQQCRRMLKRTSKGAYVWVYTSDGVKSVSADAVVSFPNESAGDLISKNPAHLFRDILACEAGDRNLVASRIFGDAGALGDFAEQLRIHHALIIHAKYQE